MRCDRCHGNRIIADIRHDGMRPPKFRPSRSIGWRVIAFPIFSNMAAVRHFELKKLIFEHVTVIVVLIFYSIPNLIKIGSHVRPPDAHNCRMFNAPLLATAVAMATASRGTCRAGMRSPKFYQNRSINRRVIAFPTFCNMAAVRHFEYGFCYS